MKPYVAGMTAKFGDSVRSAVNYQPYIRYSTSPEIFTVSADPSTLQSHFIIDDPTCNIGDIRSFPDTVTSLSSTIAKDGQLWLRTGSYFPVSSLSKPVPDKYKIYYDYWAHTPTLAAAGLGTFTITHMVGDGLGNWMAVNTSGTMYKSSDDGLSWSALAQTTTANARLACNGAGRWWYCNSSGQVFVSDNFGTSWTQQQTPAASAPAIFKFMCGVLVYVPVQAVTIGGTAGSFNSFASWLPNTNSTSQTWAGWSFNYAVTATKFNGGVTGTFYEAVTNGTDTIWFGCTATNNYIGVFAYNILTNTWYVNSFGAGNRLMGMSYDDSLGYAFVLGAYWINSSNVPSLYEASYTKTGVNASIVVNSIIQPVVTVDLQNVNAGSMYARRNGSTFAFYHIQDGYGVSVAFRLQGVSQSASPQRAPAVSSVGHSSMNPPRGIAHAGNTTIVYGGAYIYRSVPVVGIVGIMSTTPGEVKYMRIQ